MNATDWLIIGLYLAPRNNFEPLLGVLDVESVPGDVLHPLLLLFLLFIFILRVRPLRSYLRFNLFTRLVDIPIDRISGM